jgi:elongation factor Ts
MIFSPWILAVYGPLCFCFLEFDYYYILRVCCINSSKKQKKKKKNQKKNRTQTMLLLSTARRFALSTGARADLALVKQLRDMTSAGLMDCKKALAECDGNVEDAARWLRAAGLAKAGKRAGRAAAAGLVGVFRTDPATGRALAAADANPTTTRMGRGALALLPTAMVEVNAETDFAARTDKFVQLMGEIGDSLAAAAAQACEADASFAGAPPPPELLASLGERVAELSGVTGEKMVIRRAVLLPPGAQRRVFGDGGAAPTTADVVTGVYVHQPLAADPRLGSVGTLVGVGLAGAGQAASPSPPPKGETAADAAERLADAAALVAMHVAAMDPVGIDAASLPADRIAAERAAIEVSVASSGKPAEVQAKMVDGRMKKWIAEVALEEQPYCLASDPKAKEASIAHMVRGGKIVAMERFKCGEGIEIEQVDFAEEVAREMGGR